MMNSFDPSGRTVVITGANTGLGQGIALAQARAAMDESRAGVVEQVDRLSRLTSPDWMKLCAEIDAKEVRIVALDLPTSWNLAASTDEFITRMLSAIDNMMLDVLAAVAREDYEDRRRRQAEGTVRAKAAGLYKECPANTSRNAAITAMLRVGRTWSQIMSATGCSRTLLAKLAREQRDHDPSRSATN